MKSLKYTIQNELNEYDEIVRSKRGSRTTLSRLKARVKPQYQAYLKRFGSIHNHPKNSFNTIHSNNLKNCYLQPSIALNGLKARLVSAQSDTFQNLCPYCLIINHSTFDHYIPLNEQPVFGVLARNIIPCCDVCNKKKLEYWRESNRRAIIHFYNDTIPNIQFLHCDLTFHGQLPSLSFRSDFSNISKRTASRIEGHFKRLNLIKRYDRATPKLISDVYRDIAALQALKPTRAKIGRFLIQKAVGQQKDCGLNYWQSVAYDTLGKSQTFLRSL